MSNRIFKYALSFSGMYADKIDIKKDATPLTVQMQNGEVCLWALVNDQNEDEAWEIEVYGTGHSIEDQGHLSYLGTAQDHGGALVLHFFRRNQ